MEEKRTPVGRPDFKSDERRQTLLVGSTPTLFRHFFAERPGALKVFTEIAIPQERYSHSGD